MTGQQEKRCAPTDKQALQLFVVGNESNSRLALDNVKALFDKGLGEFYELQVIDVLQDYQVALDAGVLVAPMLILRTPTLRITIAGDLSDTQRVFTALTSAVQEEK